MGWTITGERWFIPGGSSVATAGARGLATTLALPGTFTGGTAAAGGTTWTAALASGPTKAFAHTTGGPAFDTAAAITSAVGFTGGSGTQASPYVIDSVHYTDETVIGDYSAGTLTGKWLKFTNCWFTGSTATGTLDALSPPLGIGANGRTTALPAMVILEDCLIAPPGSPVAAGGPNPASGGFGYTLFANECPVTVTRTNVWGGAANVWISNGAGTSAPRSTFTDCWIHDAWDSGGAHTDAVNGADPTNVSNVTFLRCIVDGKCGARTPTGRVVNAFGIYNTHAITGWVIDSCKILNGDFGVFWADTGQGAAITNMAIVNSTFDLTNIGLAHAGRTDILTQSGNVDQAGHPLTF